MKFKVISKKNNYYIKVMHNDLGWVEIINIDCKTKKSALKVFEVLKVTATFKDKPMFLFSHVETDYVLSTDND